MGRVQGVRSKRIQVKLDRATHADFKAQLAQHGLSMQEAFAEFARQVGSGGLYANNLLIRMIKTQVKEELATVGLKPMAMPRTKVSRLPELDSEQLYDLINEVDEGPEGPDLSPHRGRDEAA